MSKTIKQLAEELGISKQALQKRLTREPLKTSIQPYIYTSNNTKYIQTEGERLIKAGFSTSIPADNVSIDKSIDKTIDKAIAALTAQLESKDKQIAELHKQIAELTAAITNLSTAVNGAQTLHAADKPELTHKDKPIDIQAPAPSTPAPKQAPAEQQPRRRSDRGQQTRKAGILSHLFSRKGR